jgi:hypothetical protein
LTRRRQRQINISLRSRCKANKRECASFLPVVLYLSDDVSNYSSEQVVRKRILECCWRQCGSFLRQKNNTYPKMMTKMIKLIAFLCLFAQVCAFAPPSQTSIVRQSLRSVVAFARPADTSSSDDQRTLVDVLSEKRGFWASPVAGLVLGLGGYVARGMASDEDLEISELPPPYVPAIFGVVLLAGVGALSVRLGNVMDEGKLIAMMTMTISELVCSTFGKIDPFF